MNNILNNKSTKTYTDEYQFPEDSTREYQSEPINNSDDGYDSDDEIKIEVTDYKNGDLYTHIYTVPYKPTHSKEKRLICFSTIHNESCEYGPSCTYAHSYDQQVIDEEKKFIYQIIFDNNLMNFFSMTNPKTDDIYKHLLFLTHLCDNCINKKCTGGYNCRNGASMPSLKICKNDLLTGECLNKNIDINIDASLMEKLDFDNFKKCHTYKGYINGHHLSLHGLIPYYKYIHQKENSKKNKYQSVRYIDINPLNRIFKDNYNALYNHKDNDSYDSDSSTDEEINGWFQKKNDSDSDIDFETSPKSQKIAEVNI